MKSKDNAKRKILIIIEGITVGGTSASLLNLLTAMKSYSDIDLTVGLINIEQKDKLPSFVKVLNLDAFKRKKETKLKNVLFKLRAGLFARINLKVFKTFNRDKNSLKKIPLNQKLELKEALAQKKINLKGKYDVVISWVEMYTNYLLAYKIEADKKIAWIHPHYEQAGFSKKIDGKMIEKVDKVIAVSREGKQSLIRSFPDSAYKFGYVYNKFIVDDIVNKSKLDEVIFDNAVLNIVSLSRIQNISKGFDRSVPVMKKLRDDGFKFKWRIIGYGEDVELVKSLIKENALENEVELITTVKNPYPYVACSDLFFLCSYYEGLPMVVSEAMILKTPCIVTDYASSREQIISEETGFIVENSSDGIYQGLLDVFSNPQKLFKVKENLKKLNNENYSECKDFIALLN